MPILPTFDPENNCKKKAFSFLVMYRIDIMFSLISESLFEKNFLIRTQNYKAKRRPSTDYAIHYCMHC